MSSVNPDVVKALKQTKNNKNCFYINRRGNNNQYDMNGNFPDAFEFNNVSKHPQTVVVMK